MAESQPGLSRRRVLIGSAWAAPAVIVATALPARASSLATGGLQYVQPNGLRATANQNFWDATDARTRPATMVTADLLNVPTTPGGTSPTVISFDLTTEVPVGALVGTPKWGLGSNNQGIATAGYTWVSGPTVSNGIARLVVRYTGLISTYQGAQPWVWIETASAVAGQQVNSYVVATHEGTVTSSDAMATTTAIGFEATQAPFWTYTPPAGALALAAANVASVTGTGNNNPRVVTVSLPLAAGVSLTTVKLTVGWSPKNSSASVGATSPGGLTWSGSPTNTTTVVLNASTSITSPTSIFVSFDKANLPSSYTIRLSAFVNGSSTESTKDLSGNLS